jgi:hypothetical protein
MLEPKRSRIRPVMNITMRARAQVAPPEMVYIQGFLLALNYIANNRLNERLQPKAGAIKIAINPHSRPKILR